jgi:two-component system, cell cycle sensor histidine kinase and response regulator CckA
MVYGIVKQSGGQIAVESALGIGSTFTVYLPRVCAAAPERGKEIVRNAIPPQGRETVLVAEDEQGVRMLVTIYLGNLGYKVISAPDGDDALALARSYGGEIHLLLSDLVMPRMGGRALAAELKSIFPLLGVVFMSGYAGHGATAAELDMPDASFLSKPLSLDILAKTVRGVLDLASGVDGMAKAQRA